MAVAPKQPVKTPVSVKVDTVVNTRLEVDRPQIETIARTMLGIDQSFDAEWVDGNLVFTKATVTSETQNKEVDVPVVE